MGSWEIQSPVIKEFGRSESSRRYQARGRLYGENSPVA